MMYQAASSTESRISDPEHAQPLSESLKKIREKLFKYTKRNQFEDFEEIFTRYISTEQNKAYEKEIKEDLLMTACKYDRVQFVDFLLEDKELSPNGLPDERSPLQIATTKQHHQIIASLLAHPRIEVNRKDYGDVANRGVDICLLFFQMLQKLQWPFLLNEYLVGLIIISLTQGVRTDRHSITAYDHRYLRS